MSASNDPDDKSKQGISWLNAFYDPVANIKAFSTHIDLADLQGDGDFKLLVAGIAHQGGLQA